MEMGVYRSKVSSGFFFSSWVVCQEVGLEMNKNKQNAVKEESIHNGPSGFSEKLWSTSC